MSGMRAILPADKLPPDQYVRTIASVCDTHHVHCGSAADLALFLKALKLDKHLAMEFWSVVAQLSGQSQGLSIAAANGAVLEVVMKAVTGRGVAEMISAGSEPRRMVGELGSLLAGDAVEPLVFDSLEDDVAVLAATGKAEPDGEEVESLRADVERLKAAFEARFPKETARPVAPVRGPQLGEFAALAAAPSQTATPSPIAVPAPTAAHGQHGGRAQDTRRAHTAAAHRDVYADAMALSTKERAATVAARPVALHSNRVELDAAGRVPIPIRGPEAATAPITLAHEKSVVPREQHSGKTSRRLVAARVLLWSGLLLLLVAGVAFAALRWGWSKTPTASEVKDGSRTASPNPTGSEGMLSAAYWKGGAWVAALSAPGVAPAAVGRVPQVKPNRDESQIEQGVAAASEPPRIARAVREEGPPPVVTKIAGVSGTSDGSGVPHSLVTDVPSLPAAKVRVASASEQVRFASAATPIAAPKERMESAPVERSTPASGADKTVGTIARSIGVIPGTKISGANPTYPAFAKSAHISGSVILHAMISKTGSVENLKAVSGPEILKQNAVAAVKTWKYTPYLLNGEPAEANIEIVVKFNN